jgi:hypothetical protein
LLDVLDGPRGVEDSPQSEENPYIKNYNLLLQKIKLYKIENEWEVIKKHILIPIANEQFNVNAFDPKMLTDALIGLNIFFTIRDIYLFCQQCNIPSGTTRIN